MQCKSDLIPQKMPVAEETRLKGIITKQYGKLSYIIQSLAQYVPNVSLLELTVSQYLKKTGQTVIKMKNKIKFL